MPRLFTAQHEFIEAVEFRRDVGDEARRDVARLPLGGRHVPHELRLVDITSDATLLRDYGERIPVLAIAGREYDAPLLAAELEHALRQAAAELG